MEQGPSLSEIGTSIEQIIPIQPELGGIDKESVEGDPVIETSPPVAGKEDQVLTVDGLQEESSGDDLELSDDEQADRIKLAQMPARERIGRYLGAAREKITEALSGGSISDPKLLEQMNIALTYTGEDQKKDSAALMAMDKVLAHLNTSVINDIREQIMPFQAIELDEGGTTKIYSYEEWTSHLATLPEDQRVAVEAQARRGFVIPKEQEAPLVQPEDLLIQEGIAALLAKRDGGEALTPDQEGQLGLLELAASAKGEGGLLLKIQLLKKIGLQTDGDTELAGRLEIAQSRLDSLLVSAGVKDEDLQLLSSLSSSDVPAFMAKALTLSVNGLDSFIFGEQMSIEDMQKMFHSLPLSEEKKDALDKMPLGLPVGLGILFALLSAGLVIGKASLKEARK